MTLLMYASLKNDETLVLKLLEAGASVNISVSKRMARLYNNIEYIFYLISLASITY